MNDTAYLNVLVDVSAFPPLIVGASIHSASANGITVVGSHLRWLPVYDVKGKDYGDARQKILDTVDAQQYLAWVKPYLDSEKDHALGQYIKETVDIIKTMLIASKKMLDAILKKRAKKA